MRGDRRRQAKTLLFAFLWLTLGVQMVASKPVAALSPAFGGFDTINGSTASTVVVGAGYANTIRVAGWAATADFPTVPLGVRVRINASYTFPATNDRTADLPHPAIDGEGDRAQRRKVIAHEFGHAMGLAHPPNPGVNTVMAQGAIGGFVVEIPAAFDIGSMDIAYK